MKQVLVLGGGIAGLSAARALNKWGASVHLVEKEKTLGGKAFEWACMATDECQNCGSCLSGKLVDNAEHLENVHIHLDSRVNEISRDHKKIRATFKGPHPEFVNADAVLLATGFEPFDPSGTTSLKYTKNDRVITTSDLNRLIKTERLAELFGQLETPRMAAGKAKVRQMKAVGLDHIVTACLSCHRQLTELSKHYDLGMKVHTVAALAAEAKI